MTVDFITTEALTDDQILKCFGETLLYGEGKFIENDFFESIEGSLEDYLKRKHGDSFRQLIITRCVPDYFGGANIFNDLFYGRQF